MLYRVYRFFRVNKVSEDLNFLFENTCKVVLFGKVPAAKKPDKPDKTDPINRINRTRGVRTLEVTGNRVPKLGLFRSFPVYCKVRFLAFGSLCISCMYILQCTFQGNAMVLLIRFAQDRIEFK